MENSDTLKENIQDYIEDKIALIKLKAADKAGSSISGILVGLIMARLGLFIIIFLSLSAAYAISEATERAYLGFLIVAGFYILLAGLLVIFREKLITMPVINSLLKKIKYTDPGARKPDFSASAEK